MAIRAQAGGALNLVVETERGRLAEVFAPDDWFTETVEEERSVREWLASRGASR